MHPGELGHKKLAREVATQLQKRGWSLTMPEEGEHSVKEKSVQFRWLLVNGVPWFLKRSVDLLPAVLLLSIVEIFKIAREKLVS
jgi:hypothetical protein